MRQRARADRAKLGTNLKRGLVVLVPIVAALAVLAFPADALAGTTIVVGPSCSLDEAVQAANTDQSVDNCPAGQAGSADTIQVPAGTYDLSTGQLLISSDVNIVGAGARSTIINGSATGQRVLEISSGTVSVSGVTIEGGNTTISGGGPTPGVGGGIWVVGQATLTLEDSMVTGNQADITGGGIENDGALTVLRSTIEDNTTEGVGGGIDDLGSDLSITNSTIMGNQSQGDGGGLSLEGTSELASDTIANNVTTSGSGGGLAVSGGTTPDVVNTIVAGNLLGATPSDCSGSVTSHGNNLSDQSDCGFTASGDLQADPGFGPVDSSGETDVLSLSPTSPAIDAGNDLACPTTDQRLVTRPQGAHCDIGAYELVQAPESIAFESDRTGNSQIFTMNPDGSNVVQLTHDPSTVTDTLPSISPDGHTVVYQSTSAGVTEIWAINGDGTDPRQLTTAGSNEQPTFSPDGQKIAFDSNRNGNFQLFVMNADGSGQTQVTHTNGTVGGSGWSPDGSQIAINDDSTGTNEIYTVNVATQAVTGPLTTDGANRNPHWSPDGSKILFVSDRCNVLGEAEPPVCGGGNSVFLMNADGSNQQNLTQAPIFDADPAWSPSGSKIAFVRDLGGQNFNVFTANADGTDQVQLTNGTAPSRNSFPNWGTRVSAPGQLSGSSTQSVVDPVDLTAAGDSDWAFWGNNSAGTNLPPSGLTPSETKAGGDRQISDLSIVNGNGTPTRGFGGFPVDTLPFNFDWTDGAPDASRAPDASGNGALGGVAAPELGQGLSFTVPADTSLRKLTIWTSAHFADGTLTAHLSDGSAPDFVQTIDAPPSSPGPSQNLPAVFTLDYKAATDGQTLTVTWTESALDGGQGVDDVAIYAVALSAGLSNLTVNATPSSAGAGIDQVPISTIPNAWLSFFAGSTSSTPVGSTPVGSTPVGSTPVGSTPVGSTPVGSTPVGSTPVGSTPVGSTPVGSTGLFDLPVGSTPVGSTALSSVLLSQVQLHGVTWDQILCGSLAAKPLTAITLQDLKTNTETCTDGKTSLQHFEALTMQQVDLTTTLLKSVHWATLLMGNTPLSDLDGGFDAWCGTNGLIPTDGGSCTNAGPSTTVLQMDVAGQLGSAPVGSTPVGSTPVGSTPVGSTPVGSTDVSASLLANIPLADIDNDDHDLASVVDCTKVNCSTGTLGDAYTANAILPTATFSDLANAMAANNITINDLVVAIIGAAGFPWEQLPIQGLQPYSATPSKVTYTISNQVDCSLAPEYTITAQLPAEFFPVNGSAQFVIGNNPAQPAGPPSVLGNNAADSKTNGYRWTVDCPAGDDSLETATLSFDAWVGLNLGTFTTHVDATTAIASIGATGAPVTVHQNSEAGDPSTANQIQPNTLVVGHIASSGEQAFYKVNIGNLPQGTRLQAFLNVPSNADLDLTISAPAAPSFFSTPVGSTPVGSTPIEDDGVGFAGLGQGLSPDTLQDVPVGSTPVGSTPVGSTPVGSTSDARGDGVNEAGAIITSGQSGFATIGVSGYNGATSNQPFVLRVQETPPPALPACPARTFANGSPSSFAAGTLPNSLPTSTKTVFIVDKQRLTAMYGASAVTGLLNSLNTLAARSEVAGTVLDVDGNAAVRSAYSAWDATPCNTAARNNVVTAINNVVATYRNSTAGLPNLHYVVLVGSDEATPMANVPDPVTLSPEENEAADLAFTTNGLTKGNALYASAAQNNILTDGAYGAFTAIPWLGSNLLLPQISVSRLVETPSDIVGQINRYLGNNGISAPQSAAGTLKPTSALVTGYDFLADGAKAVHDNLKANFTGLTTLDTFASGDLAINFPGFPNPWTANDALTGALQSSSAPSIVSIDGHYNQYELESASGDLANTGQATANLAARILFTMGCHGGLNISDTLGGATSPVNKYLDWPELYARDQAAMYIGNTGYGYGDSESVALSERLLALFAKNLHSDSGSVGEEWVDALQQYYATAGAYDVYDQKVMEETTFYGLPFWHFSTAGSSPAFTPLTTTADPITGTQSATVSFPAAGDTTQSQFGLYRPILPITSQQVTSSLPARGVWIKSLTSSDSNTNATIGYPTVDSTAHEQAPAISPIFFPASPFTLEHSLAFGSERDYLNVSDQFRPTGPGAAGVQRHFTGGSFEIFYSQSSDPVAPLISEVNVSTTAGVATVTARVEDNSGPVAEVAALVNDGHWHYLQLSQSAQDPTLWSATISVAEDPEVFVEATDGINVSYSANKGENFTSTNSAPPAGPQILIASPVGPYAANANVIATYSCPGAVSCVGTVPSGSPIDTSPGKHIFLVTATDADGNVTTLERTYSVGDLALSLTITPSTAHAGSAVVLKASLTNTSSSAQSVTVSATFGFGTKFVVNVPPVTFTLGAGKTLAVTLPFVVLKNTPKGTYAVTLHASDSSGPVAATAALTVN
jgi:WD40-like Beta Propeller Repeat